MESEDLELIAKHRKENDALAKLYDEHVTIEKQLEKFDRKPYLNPQEELKRKDLQKQKLLGRDQMEQILSQYR